MKPEIRTALVAANAATAAVNAAKAAAGLLETLPDAWAVADEAYWLCRAAAKAAEHAADNLCPEWAKFEDGTAYAHTEASRASVEAQEMADELVSLAEAAGHTIRR